MNETVVSNLDATNNWGCGVLAAPSVVTNTIERFYDAFGRDAGYALNGVRQSTLAYDAATGRLASMQIPSIEESNHLSPTLNSNFFTWTYLAGSDLKSSLTYPNGLTASWTYGNRGELLEVNNASPTGTISKYAYTYDAAGRRVACAKSGTAFERSDSVNYGYNARSELTSATAAVDSDYRYGYNFDDIGNRKTSSERGTNSVYTASQLNQYTAVDDFTPTYDADGNETLVKTATGIWQVSYNGENRPVLWTQGTNTISMSYDRMGRRVTKNDQRFVYNGYLQIADNFGNAYVWDPTEPVATRPLVWNFSTVQPFNSSTFFYTHDGNKNVSEVIDSDGTLVAHYEYAPFGALTVSRGASAAANPWRFSSEYAEDDTATVYYNYRHYEPWAGRWMSRDPMEEECGIAIYLFIDNHPLDAIDLLGKEERDGCLEVDLGEQEKWVGFGRCRVEKYVGKYKYKLKWDTNCDSHNHAHIRNVSVTDGDLERHIDDLGISVGWKFISVEFGRSYVVEWNEGIADSDESARCEWETVYIYVYLISGVSFGASVPTSVNTNVGASAGPLTNKTLIGSTKEKIKWCCCESSGKE